jgi:hypothetical protein
MAIGNAIPWRERESFEAADALVQRLLPRNVSIRYDAKQCTGAVVARDMAPWSEIVSPTS